MLLAKNAQSYMDKYTAQQKRHKQEGSLPKFPVLHVYIPSTAAQT